MSAPGLIRTKTELRIISLAARLEGWQAGPDSDADWWVTGPIRGQRTNARTCVIGAPDGAINPEAHRAGSDPSVDVWTIPSGLSIAGVEDGPTAKQELEDALNQLADLFAANHRLVDEEADVSWLGCEQVRIEDVEGPVHFWEQGKTALAFLDFDIVARAQIRRNPS